MHYLEQASVFEQWGCPIGRGHIYIYTFVCSMGCMLWLWCRSVCHVHCACFLQFHLLSVQRSALAMCVPRCACVPPRFLWFGWVVAVTCHSVGFSDVMFSSYVNQPFCVCFVGNFWIVGAPLFWLQGKIVFPTHPLSPHFFLFFTLPSLHSLAYPSVVLDMWPMWPVTVRSVPLSQCDKLWHSPIIEWQKEILYIYVRVKPSDMSVVRPAFLFLFIFNFYNL